MKHKFFLLGLAFVAVFATTAFAAAGSPNNSATPVIGNGNVPVTLSANGSLSLLNAKNVSTSNKGNVGTDVSDGYVVEDVPGENDSTLEFWEIAGFEDWMEQQRAENQKLADNSDKSFYAKDANGDYVCREWTQADVDALYVQWQEQLTLMKQGYRFTKSVILSDGGGIVGVFDPEMRSALPQTASDDNGNNICREWTPEEGVPNTGWQEQFTTPIILSDGSSIVGEFDPATLNALPQTALGSTIITLPNGSVVNLGHFDTADEAKKAVEEYLKQQVAKGVLTQREADTILANGSVE